MNRAKIKEQARGLIKDNLWYLLKPLVIIGLISFVASGILTILFGSESTVTNLATSLIELAILPITFGYQVYVLKFVRKEKMEINDIFKYYDKFVPIFLLYFLVGLFTTLWTFLLIVPGIIAAISYQQSTLIMIDGEEDAMQCIKKSKAMMNGYKADYFMFMLSFIGWYLLVGITLGIAAIYVIPYVEVAECLYYEELKKIQQN